MPSLFPVTLTLTLALKYFSSRQWVLFGDNLCLLCFIQCPLYFQWPWPWRWHWSISRPVSASCLEIIFVVLYTTFSLFPVTLTLTLGLKYFSSRQCVLMGGILCVISFILTSRAEHLYFLVFSYGVIFGKYRIHVSLTNFQFCGHCKLAHDYIVEKKLKVS